MKKSKFTESQIIAILKEADAGVMVKDICRKQGISSPTYYSWKSKYGGMAALSYGKKSPSFFKRTDCRCGLLHH